jgi:hypothetical protein
MALVDMVTPFNVLSLSAVAEGVIETRAVRRGHRYARAFA